MRSLRLVCPDYFSIDRLCIMFLNFSLSLCETNITFQPQTRCKFVLATRKIVVRSAIITINHILELMRLVKKKSQQENQGNLERIQKLGCGDFLKKKLDTCHVLPICYMTTIPKFHFEILLFTRNSEKYWLGIRQKTKRKSKEILFFLYPSQKPLGPFGGQKMYKNLFSQLFFLR